jgi:hypothetical protein
MIDLVDVELHQIRMEQIVKQYPLDRVINMDETSWKLLNYGFVTVAKWGSETVDCLCDDDPKMCLTAIAAIDADGGKFPLWILCHGKTERCERRYRDADVLERSIRRGELVLLHQENGWTNTEVVLNYLRWSRFRFAGGEIVLMWNGMYSPNIVQKKWSHSPERLGSAWSLFHRE